MSACAAIVAAFAISGYSLLQDKENVALQYNKSATNNHIQKIESAGNNKNKVHPEYGVINNEWKSSNPNGECISLVAEVSGLRCK